MADEAQRAARCEVPGVGLTTVARRGFPRSHELNQSVLVNNAREGTRRFGGSEGSQMVSRADRQHSRL